MGQFSSVSMLGNSLKVCLTFLAILTIGINNVFSEALMDSIYIDDLDHKTTKHRFRDAKEPQYIKFGTTRDNDAVHNIRFGQLKLYGWIISMEFFYYDLLTVYSSDVERFFQPSIDCIVDAVMEQRKISKSPISVCREDLYPKLDRCLRSHSGCCSSWWICSQRLAI